MSNQQPPPYGQPQYGPQYGGYPPPPPPPPPAGSNKALLIVFSIVVAMIVLGAGAFVVSRFTADPAGGSAEGGPVTSQPPSEPVDTPTTGGSPSEEPSDPPSSPSRLAPACADCIPGVTVKSLVGAFKAKGYSCKLDRSWKCTKGNVDVSISPDYTEKAYVSDVDVSGSSTARVENCPQCITGAVNALKQGLPTALALFVKDPKVRQQMVAFAVQHANVPASGPGSAGDATIGGYRLSLLGYSGVTVGKNGRYATSYSTSVTIYGTRQGDG